MTCGGCKEVVVKILDEKGRVIAKPFRGIMANGGFLSLEKPLQLKDGEFLRLEHGRTSEKWDVRILTPSPSKGKNNKRYKYNVNLVPVS